MARRVLMAVCCGMVVAASVYLGAAGSAQQPAPLAPVSSHPGRALLDQYCVTCHNPKLKTGGLTLDTLDPSNVGESAATWEKVVLKLNAGMMPPIGRPRPSADAQAAFVSSLETALDRAAQIHVNAGRPETFHRLNRFEYKNAVRDVLALDIDVAALLPTDDAGYGFDNVAGVLKLSQSLMERYLTAARKVSRLAVGSPPLGSLSDTFTISSDRRQYERVEGLPFGTRGGTLVRYNFPRDGQYFIRAAFICNFTAVNSCDGTSGYEDTHQLEVTIDGERVHVWELGRLTPRRTRGEEKDAADLQWEVRLPVKAGLRDVGVTFVKLPSYETSSYGRLRFDAPTYEGNMVPEGLGVYQPYLASVTIGGPFEATGGPRDTASRRRVFVCSPANAAEEAPCAKKIFANMARTAYRRPVTDSDVQGLLSFYNDARKTGSPFEEGIEIGLRALLVSPSFLFRVEHDPASKRGVNVPASTSPQSSTAISNYRISDVDLASRLSFFLWSSIPDRELLDVAAQGKLRDPAILERQVRRMLADSRSSALSTNFLPQWLQIRGLDFVSPADPNFDETLRDSMVQETELFFDSFVREDRSVPELLTANYTFLNERLAAHYGIPEVKGSHFRRVVLSDDNPHRGLLGQGSVLTVTSHAIRTSPVKRGKWIMESILGAAPPPPPPAVPVLEEGKDGAASAKPLSMRERMAAHRANPTCAGCHSMIDPLGFALENFDQTGKFRTADDTLKPVDASGQFPNGTKFSNLAEFRAALGRHPDQFVAALTERLLTYALGRGLEYYDRPVIRAIARGAAGSNYRVSSIVMGIVKSVPFQMRRSLAPSSETVAAVRP